MERQKVVYSRNSNLLGRKKLYIAKVGNKRKYPNYIKFYDNVFVVGIEDNVKCPVCGSTINVSTEFPYSYDDLIAMWKEAFKVVVLQEEQLKILAKLKDLVNWMEDLIFK